MFHILYLYLQDLHYLSQAGSYLTNHHGLCNVGQWHSHHRINLFKPSEGDNNTVWNNMPNLGLDRYIVFIANIKNMHDVSINCFLFHASGYRTQQGKFKFCNGNSPFRLNEQILRNVHREAESLNKIATFEREMKYIRNRSPGSKDNLHSNHEKQNRHNAECYHTYATSSYKFTEYGSHKHKPNVKTSKASQGQHEKNTARKSKNYTDHAPRNQKDKQGTKNGERDKGNEKVPDNYKAEISTADGRTEHEFNTARKTNKHPENKNKLVPQDLYDPRKDRKELDIVAQSSNNRNLSTVQEGKERQQEMTETAACKISLNTKDAPKTTTVVTQEQSQRPTTPSGTVQPIVHDSKNEEANAATQRTRSIWKIYFTGIGCCWCSKSTSNLNEPEVTGKNTGDEGRANEYEQTTHL